MLLAGSSPGARPRGRVSSGTVPCWPQDMAGQVVWGDAGALRANGVHGTCHHLEVTVPVLETACYHFSTLMKWKQNQFYSRCRLFIRVFPPHLESLILVLQEREFGLAGILHGADLPPKALPAQSGKGVFVVGLSWAPPPPKHGAHKAHFLQPRR